MRQLFLILLISSFLACIKCEQSHQFHQLTTLEVQNLNQWTYQNLRHHHKQHHEANSGKDALTLLLIKYLIGPLMFLSSFATIWLNEKKAVLDYKRLLLAQQICQQVNPSNKQQITSNHGLLSYVSGQARTNHVITDQISSVSVKNSMKLIRTVEVMEWRQKNKKNDNKNENIEYILDWCQLNQPTVLIKSNPPQNWFIDNQTFYNPNVFVGEYNISQSQIDMCKKILKITPDMQNVQQIVMRKKLKQKGIIIDNYIYFASPTNNEINGEGALRIKYQYCPLSSLTIVAKTTNKSFQPFPIAEYQNNGNKIQDDELPLGCIFCACVGQYLVPITEINFLFQENFTKEEIFSKKKKQTKKFAFLVRGISFLMMIIGFCLLFAPLIDILGFVPLVGGFLKGSLILIIIFGGFIICIPLWIITFSIAWTWYHPKVGLIFLGIGLTVLSAILIFNQISNKNVHQIDHII